MAEEKKDQKPPEEDVDKKETEELSDEELDTVAGGRAKPKDPIIT